MIIDELVLHNFGLYAGRQKILLTPPDGNRPIILFGGLNGHGKTTLLDAMQLCLYGPFARISNRDGLAYKDCLSRSTNHDSKEGKASIELAFRHTVDGKEDRFRLHRSWQKGANGCRESLTILKNRCRDDLLAENWISQVEDLFPPNIANLFFFDGEQVEGYAARDTSTKLIGAAVRNLLGLDIVDQLDKDIQVYQRRKWSENKEDSHRIEIEKTEADLKELRRRISEMRQDQASLMTAQIIPARKSLEAVQDEFRNLGGELYENRIKIEQEAVEAEQAVYDNATQLKELASSDLPLLLVYSLLNDVFKRDIVEEETRRSRDVSILLEKRDEQLLKLLRDWNVDASALGTVETYLGSDRERRRKLGGRSTNLDFRPDVRNNLRDLLDGRLSDLERTARSMLATWEDVSARLEHARAMKDSIPDSDTVLEIVRRRDQIIGSIATFEAENAAIESEIQHLTGKAERTEHALVRILEANSAKESLRNERARAFEHATRARNSLSKFRNAVIARHVHRIEQLVLESYQQLLRKDALVTHLEIDPESFVLTLYGRGGHEFDVDQLSAGERQLLAVALLWGLAKTSGRPLPTAIDTPLGRLDSGHRKHLVERYFPFASHQVLLFSTDEEIVGTRFKTLKPFIGRSYLLDYDDAIGSTKIVDGYFENLKVQ